MQTRYLIDSNVFIQAKNREYQFCFCGSFWTWIEHAHVCEMIFSVKKVRDEIREKEDEVKIWCDALPATFFIEDSGSKEVMANYAKLMSWSQSSEQYTKAAKDQFALPKKADAFLIAAAMTGGFEIVTHETVQPAARQRIPIPNAAAAFNVKWINIYDLLAKHALPTFVINP